jgi:hypothetical protein
MERYGRPRTIVASPPMPCASGVECVRVLVGLGWMATTWNDRECLLEKGRTVLAVPLEPVLQPSLVAAIAGAAGISPLAFVAALERMRTPLPRPLHADGKSFR